ncbi:hypothetical protein AOX63_01310 [Pseudomonas sp. ADP]|nr:hypothetical protein AOX63_01310 [Pseudomonas sp. ADP]
MISGVEGGGFMGVMGWLAWGDKQLWFEAVVSAVRVVLLQVGGGVFPVGASLNSRMGFAGGVGAGVKSALSPTLSRKRERGPFGVDGESRVILILLTTPVIPANAGRGSIANSACAGPKGNNPVTAGFASKLAPTKSKSASALGFPEK